MILWINSYEGWSESSVSNFIMSAHNVWGGCSWYGSRGWNFSSVFCYVLLPWNRWQQRGNLTKQHLTGKCAWSKGVALNPSMGGGETHKNTLTDIHRCFLNIYRDQRIDVSTVRKWVMHCSKVRTTVGDFHWCRFLLSWHAVKKI